MRVLAVTNLFPNAAQPLASPFNRQQFAALGRLCHVDVLATIPWFPGAQGIAASSAAAVGRRVPQREVIDGLEVWHPRTLHIPRIGSAVAAPLFAASLLPHIRRYRGRVDVLLGSWAYPDGCAAVALARVLGIPAVVKLHGSDMNIVAKLPGPRRYLRTLLPRAAAVVAVSRALADEARQLGVAAERIHIVMNGVDGSLFFPRDRARARAELGVPAQARLALYVGNLKESKGIRDLLEAFAAARDERDDLLLAVVGGGPEAAHVTDAAHRSPGVLALGPQPLERIPSWMAACDVVVLPSWNEGTPNVVLEALACGRRVVATRVGGVPDLLAPAAVGELVEPRHPRELASALLRAATTDYDPAHIARLGARGDWDQSARDLRDVLRGAVSTRARRGSR